MRGDIKTDEYFEEQLKKTDENLAYYHGLLEKGEDFPGVRNAYLILGTEYAKLFDQAYTARSGAYV